MGMRCVVCLKESKQLDWGRPDGWDFVVGADGKSLLLLCPEHRGILGAPFS